MNLAKTNLNFKGMMACWIAAVLVLGLSGCGKSEAEKAREAAKNKFLEKIAAIKVCAQGSTYSEFRQAVLDFRTCYEANKQELSDLSFGFDSLNETLEACDYCWQKANVQVTLDNGETHFLSYKNPAARRALLVINPSVTNKFNLTIEQRYHDEEFDAEYNVKLALSEINAVCDLLLLTKNITPAHHAPGK